MTEFLLQNGLISIKMIIAIHNFIREVPLFLIFFELPYFNQEITYISDEISQTHESRVTHIFSQLLQQRVLTVRVSVIKIGDTQQKSLI